MNKAAPGAYGEWLFFYICIPEEVEGTKGRRVEEWEKYEDYEK